MIMLKLQQTLKAGAKIHKLATNLSSDLNISSNFSISFKFCQITTYSEILGMLGLGTQIFIIHQ